MFRDFPLVAPVLYEDRGLESIELMEETLEEFGWIPEAVRQDGA